MFRKTALGITAAVALAAGMASSATTASAGPKVHIQFGFGAPAYAYSHPAPYYGAPYPVRYHCEKVFVGYQKVWTGYGWKKRPIFQRQCY